MAGYTSELRTQWRPIAGGFLGMSAGLSTTAFVLALMGRYLVEDMGWTKAQFALVSIAAISSSFAFPFAGRLGDIIGPRRTAIIGVVSMPIVFLAFSIITSFTEFIVIYLIQCILTVTTTAPIYCRIIVQHVERARGLALALAASGPGIMGIFATPLIGGFTDDHGWRAAYVMMAAAFAIAGSIAIWLLPPDRPKRAAGEAAAPPPPKRHARRDFAILVRMPAFWIILVGIFLISIPYVVLPQMSLILGENGVAPHTAALMVSAYAVGMLIGRVISGVALDRFSPPFVAFLGLALSAIGIFIIASRLETEPVLYAAILLIGLSYGSESDVIAFMIGRYFGVSVYSTVFGMTSSIITAGTASGAGLLSVMLRQTNSYGTFLYVGGAAVLLGSVLFLLLPRHPVIPDFEGGDRDRPLTPCEENAVTPPQAP